MDTRTKSVRIDKNLHRELKIRAAQEGMSFVDWVELWLTLSISIGLKKKKGKA